MKDEDRKCHNCGGTGVTKRTSCAYCRGKGWRDTRYGRDKTEGYK